MRSRVASSSAEHGASARASHAAPSTRGISSCRSALERVKRVGSGRRKSQRNWIAMPICIRLLCASGSPPLGQRRLLSSLHACGKLCANAPRATNV